MLFDPIVMMYWGLGHKGMLLSIKNSTLYFNFLGGRRGDISQLSVKSSIKMGYFFKGKVYHWGRSQNIGAQNYSQVTLNPMPTPLPKKRYIPFFKKSLKVKFSIIKIVKGYF